MASQRAGGGCFTRELSWPADQGSRRTAGLNSSYNSSLLQRGKGKHEREEREKGRRTWRTEGGRNGRKMGRVLLTRQIVCCRKPKAGRRMNSARFSVPRLLPGYCSGIPGSVLHGLRMAAQAPSIMPASQLARGKERRQRSPSFVLRTYLSVHWASFGSLVGIVGHWDRQHYCLSPSEDSTCLPETSLEEESYTGTDAVLGGLSWPV